jgi:hypothetical protein
MNKLQQKFEDAATSNGWKIDWADNKFCAWRDVEQPADGYPEMVMGEIEGQSLINGKIFNNYGQGEEEFSAGMRYILAVLENVNNPLRYKVFYQKYLEEFPHERSEKVMSERSGVSERQIRRARMCGFTDIWVMDALCTKLLKLSPEFLYGFDPFLDDVDVDFEDDWETWEQEYHDEKNKRVRGQSPDNRIA